MKDIQNILMTQLKRTVRAVSGFPSVRAFFSDLGTLAELFSAWRRNRYRDISKPAAVTLILAVVYTAFPFDILPDIFPLIGFIDDIAVLKLVSDALRHEIRKFRIWQNWMEDTARERTSSPL